MTCPAPGRLLLLLCTLCYQWVLPVQNCQQRRARQQCAHAYHQPGK